MPLTLVEIQSLIAALGVKIPEDILAEKAKAEEFSKRREKVATEAGGKPADWRLRAKFADALKRADDSAGQKQFDAAFVRLDEAGQLLQQPDIDPEILATLQKLAERQAALEVEISRTNAFESPNGADLKSSMAAVAQALQARNAEAAAKLLDEAEALLKSKPAESPTPDASAQPNDSSTVPAKGAMATWQAARTNALGTLKALENAIRAMDDPDGAAAIILVRAIHGNLTAVPSTPRQVAELERYITTDDIIAEAEAPNGFGIKVELRAPLLAALTRLRTETVEEASV